MAGNVKKRDKVCAVGLLLFFNVSFIIRQLDYIWHGFHFTNMIPYRFSFLYSFVVLYMAYKAWISRWEFKTWQILLAGLLTAGILACHEGLLDTETLELGSLNLEIPVYLIYNLVFLAAYLTVFLWGRKMFPIPEDATDRQILRIWATNTRHRAEAAWMLLGIMGVELVGTLICFGLYFPGTSVANYPKGTTYTASVIRYMKEREEDTLFYRAETTHSQTLNDGALNGYRGVSAFTSSANVHVTEFMRALGYGAKNTYNRYLFEESSPVANLFLGLKYMLDRDGKDKTSTYFQEVNSFGDTTLLENTAYLPLGFLAEGELGEVDFAASNGTFSFQNTLFSAATGVEGDVWHKLQGENLTITGNGVTISEENSAGYCKYSKCQSGSDVTYSFVADRDGFACIHLNLPKRNDYYVSVNGVEKFKESISLSQMMAVGDVQAGDVIDIRITCDKDESSTMTVSAAVLDPERFRAGYEVLAASTLELTTFRSTLVEGTISCDRDGLLYTSIPQNGNWFVTVDGREVEAQLVGDCMVAVSLTEGDHTITFRYHNAAFSLGWKLSLACALVFLTLSWWVYKSEWKK